MRSRFSNWKKLSATALSWQLPRRLMLLFKLWDAIKWSYPRIIDTGLREFMIFKLVWAETATGTVPTPTIIMTFNMIKYCCFHCLPTDKTLTANALYFHWVKVAFYAGVIIAAAFFNTAFLVRHTRPEWPTHRARSQWTPIDERLVVGFPVVDFERFFATGYRQRVRNVMVWSWSWPKVRFIQQSLFLTKKCLLEADN